MVRVGDRVRLVDDTASGEERDSWEVIGIKSNFKGLWIKLDSDMHLEVWHDSRYYEVLSDG